MALEFFGLKRESAYYEKDIEDAWWRKDKLTDNWLDKVFAAFFGAVRFPQGFYKRGYHLLISLLEKQEIDPEIINKLDLLNETII